ncbi:MAG TPA: cation-transporting P-type ATPase, partial [Leptospiraceae bacterium]|nr:cation-transporting P-type ATPase [Leptospiraceae bacterium]
ICFIHLEINKMMFTIWKRNNEEKKGDDDNNVGEDKIPIKKEITESYHKQSLKELAAKFETSLENGLSVSTANQLLAKHGPNKIRQKNEHKSQNRHLPHPLPFSEFLSLCD